jgi:hypothetical protein
MRRQILLAGVVAGAMALGAGAAPIVFDDFNTTEGHFGYAPGFSGTTVGESANSTADRVETDSPLEGLGHQKLVFIHDGTTTNLRVRHLSGGPPYTSTQGGAPAFNTAFTTSAGVDGFIGFYLKTLAQGWTVGMNLDGADAAAASMDMGHPISVIGDGQWHLYEWNLDDDTQWDAVTSIGGDGTIQEGQHTIDSIYFFTNATGTNGQAQPDAFLDFVAKSDSGSIAALVPEPAALGVLALGGLALFRRVRRASFQ